MRRRNGHHRPDRHQEQQPAGIPSQKRAQRRADKIGQRECGRQTDNERHRHPAVGGEAEQPSVAEFGHQSARPNPRAGFGPPVAQSSNSTYATTGVGRHRIAELHQASDIARGDDVGFDPSRYCQLAAFQVVGQRQVAEANRCPSRAAAQVSFRHLADSRSRPAASNRRGCRLDALAMLQGAGGVIGDGLAPVAAVAGGTDRMRPEIR